MEITRLSHEVLHCKIPTPNFKIVWISDLHKDSEYSEWSKVKKYLKENPDVYIVIGGDSLDVMQFVNDKRGTKSSTLDIYNHTDYANRVIRDVREEVVLPFKDRIISWNRGNHDNSIIRRHNLDLLGLICGVDVPVHEYSGYIILSAEHGVGKKFVATSAVHFSHSPFAGGTRSKGSLSIDLAKASYPSADVWITEHIHDGFIHPVRHEFLTRTGQIKQHAKWYVQNIAAKQETQKKRNGFHHETNKGNRASGFVELEYQTSLCDHELRCTRVNFIVF
jgi:hypothetical protein